MSGTKCEGVSDLCSTSKVLPVGDGVMLPPWLLAAAGDGTILHVRRKKIEHCTTTDHDVNGSRLKWHLDGILHRTRADPETARNQQRAARAKLGPTSKKKHISTRKNPSVHHT